MNNVQNFVTLLLGTTIPEMLKLSKVLFYFEDPPEDEVEKQGVEVDADDDGPCELSELAPQLGVLSVSEQTSLDLDMHKLVSVIYLYYQKSEAD